MAGACSRFVMFYVRYKAANLSRRIIITTAIVSKLKSSSVLELYVGPNEVLPVRTTALGARVKIQVASP